jgi:hypothetical protein
MTIAMEQLEIHGSLMAAVDDVSPGDRPHEGSTISRQRESAKKTHAAFNRRLGNVVGQQQQQQQVEAKWLLRRICRTVASKLVDL